MNNINEFMNKYSKIIDEISIEYMKNYKDKGYAIIGGGNLNSNLKTEKCFIEISKAGSKIEQDRERAKIWNFENCNNVSIVVTIANQLMNNLK